MARVVSPRRAAQPIERASMPEPIEILISETPNPNAVKITLSRIVITEGKTYRDAAATDVLWAKALLAIPGVIGVYGIHNFISVNKSPEADWQVILPQAKQALAQIFS